MENITPQTDLRKAEQDAIKPVLKERITKVIEEIQKIRNMAVMGDLLNDQMYLDFEDFLNKVSVMDPEEGFLS